MLARPLVDSMVAGLSIDFSPREQIPRTLARFRFSSIARSSRRKDCISWLCKGTSTAAWANSYDARPWSVKRQTLALTTPSSVAPLVVSHGTATGIDIHQHFMVLQEKMMLQRSSFQGAFEVKFHKCLPNVREDDPRGSCGFELVFYHAKLGQGILMLHRVRQDVKSHRELSTCGRFCRAKA